MSDFALHKGERVMRDEVDYHDGIECPQCGFTQTEPSRHKEDEWFCFLCGSIWNPEEDDYDQSIEQWVKIGEDEE
jgi:rubredoxin